jgi:hypothetical protein
MKFLLFYYIFFVVLFIGLMAQYGRIDPPPDCKSSYPCVKLKCPWDKWCQTYQDVTLLRGWCLDMDIKGAGK